MSLKPWNKIKTLVQDDFTRSVLLFQINEAMSVIGQLNMYNLYAECYRGPSTNNSRLQSLYDPRISLLSKPNVTLNAQMRVSYVS